MNTWQISRKTITPEGLLARFLELVWGLLVSSGFFLQSVPAIAARRVDRLELLEVEVGDRLELVGQPRSFEVFRQVVEPVAVFDLQSDQRRYRSCPTSGPWRETRRRRGARSAGLLAQLGTASRLPLGSSQGCLVDAMSGNTDLRLSNVTVTFPGWLGPSVGFVVPDKPAVGARPSEGSSPSRREHRATNLYPVGSVVS